MSVRDALRKASEGADLTSDEAAAALEEVVSGDVPEALVAGLLVALRMKGETPAEIAGLARTMREHAVAVTPSRDGLVDTCGTGGDAKGTVNISTAAAFVVAGAGLPVAKHGNRALSSKAGSADVLEVLGVRLDLSADDVARCIDEAGIGFLFAPAFHPAMAKVMPVRKALGIRTAFNILGPLTNPARPAYQLVGVGHPSLAGLVAGALGELGAGGAVVVHGAGGTDELTLAGENLVLRVSDGRVTEETLRPEDVGLDEAPLTALAGGTPEENAEGLRRILDGEAGAIADAVFLNAAGAFVAAGAVETFRDGVELARETVSAGRAGEALERLVTVCAAART